MREKGKKLSETPVADRRLEREKDFNAVGRNEIY